jgi:ATP adenylyltransferase/5',5'''-P-1,P-4-tetraphosphate phosphorylase II
MGTKTTKTIGFCNQNKNKGSLIPNPNHEIKKNENKNMTHANNNPTRFYCFEEIKSKQGYHPKLLLNKLKVMKNSTLTYTHWAPSSKKI